MHDDRILSTARTLPFTPEAVYGAFASPEALAAWWGPAGFRNEFEHFEFREGGRWQFVMVGPDGHRYPNQNVFQTLLPGRQVVIRHDGAPWFTLTVDLEAVDGGTWLSWRQAFDDLATARAVEAIVGPANEQNLDRLTRVLQGLAADAR
jgi:uncharacterized protein YndB with AHSA1/START domain